MSNFFDLLKEMIQNREKPNENDLQKARDILEAIPEFTAEIGFSLIWAIGEKISGVRD